MKMLLTETLLIGKAMKTLRIIFGIAAFSIFAGACTNEVELPFTESECRLTATIEGSPETRTTLGPEAYGVSKVLWSEGDKIGVNVDNVGSFNSFTLVEGAGTGRAVFSGYGSGSKYVAVYPLSSITEIGDDEASMVLPSVQAYTEGSFSSGSYPMVAVSGSSDLEFRNLCSVLKVSMTGNHVVTRLMFRSNDSSVKVSGPATVSLADPENPVLTMSQEGCDSLVVNVGQIELDDEVATEFFLVLPPQTYKGGFTVRIYTNSGYMDKVLDSDFTMKRARKHDAKPFAVKLDVGVDPSKALYGSGTEKDPFLISSLGDLLLMRDRVNNSSDIKTIDGISVPAAGASYLLTADLDLAPLCGPGIGNWIPIALMGDDSQLVFYGSFNGGGHEISNLYINDPVGSYKGFFGVVSGVVRNLTVSGDFDIHTMSGILSGYTREGALVDNCISKGRIRGNYYIGGLVGQSRGNIQYSRNEASVYGREAAGGITADLYFSDMKHCTNVGEIAGSTYVGGVAGYIFAGIASDCVNTGKVEGESWVGGISGSISYGAKVLNGIFSGDVRGVEYVGGIGGLLSSYAIANRGATSIVNCISLGKVEMTGGSYGGQFAGFIGLPEGETPFDNELPSDVLVKNCYSLAGAGSLPDVGGGPGVSEDVFALTDAQLKGARYNGTLYTNSDGVAFDVLLDALNAAAVELGRTWKCTLSNWEYPAPGSYPALSDLPAQMPGKEKPVFEVVGDSFEFNVNTSRFEVQVTSSLDYTVENLPDWITELSAVSGSNTPHTKVHTFEVAANTTGQARECVLVVRNAAGSSRRIKVSQKAPYLTISETEATFYSIGGSKSIKVSSSVDWVVTLEEEGGWYSVSPRKGYSDGSVTITVVENNSPLSRGGYVVVSSADGTIEHKVTFIQSGIAAEGDDDSWMELPFHHESVAMRLTATWCQWCPFTNSAIEGAQEMYPGKIQHLALHEGASDLAFMQESVLADFYNIHAYPSGLVDGRMRVDNDANNPENAIRNFVTLCKETEETYGTVSGLAIRSSASGTRVSIDLTGYFKVAGDYKITVLLVEDGIVNPQHYGSIVIDDYVHDNIARVAASDIMGDAFKIDMDFSKREFHYNATLPPQCKSENMRVFAYIQRTFGSFPRRQNGNYGDYFIDNCATAPVGDLLKVALEGGTGGGEGNGDGNEGVTPGGEIK